MAELGAALLLISSTSLLRAGDTFRIAVFELFEPTALHLQPAEGALNLREEGADRWLRHGQSLKLASAADQVAWTETGAEGRWGTAPAVLAGNEDSPLQLSVPGRIERTYRGRLEVTLREGRLRAVLTTPMETAVASIVAAEMPSGAPLAALMAQAVAARSYLVANRGRHGSFDFCDTTHCQFLRAPPPPHHPAARAAARTAALILTAAGVPIGAMYSRSCGGVTKSLAEIGLPARGYPFYSVQCRVCRKDPETWSRRLSLTSARGLFARPGEEAVRLQLVRQRGWSQIPGNNYSVERQADAAVIRGRGAGHGVGLCQRGALGMAAQGAGFLEILRHYFPNTSLETSAECRSRIGG